MMSQTNDKKMLLKGGCNPLCPSPESTSVIHLKEKKIVYHLITSLISFG